MDRSSSGYCAESSRNLAERDRPIDRREETGARQQFERGLLRRRVLRNGSQKWSRVVRLDAARTLFP
jgi:hypothetical protein